MRRILHLGVKVSLTRVLLVDDHTILRQSLRALLELGGAVTVVGEAGSGRECLECLELVECDVVLLDMSLPDIEGIGCIQQIKRAWPSLAILVLSMHTDDALVVGALQAGANGYLPKDATREELLAALRDVSSGGSYIHRRVAGALVQAVRRNGPSSEGAVLTDRELEVLALSAAGNSNQQIADTLHVSLSTVKSCLTGIYRKLEVTDRTQAVLEALRRGLIPAPGSKSRPLG